MKDLYIHCIVYPLWNHFFNLTGPGPVIAYLDLFYAPCLQLFFAGNVKLRFSPARTIAKPDAGETS